MWTSSSSTLGSSRMARALRWAHERWPAPSSDGAHPASSLPFPVDHFTRLMKEHRRMTARQCAHGRDRPSCQSSSVSLALPSSAAMPAVLGSWLRGSASAGLPPALTLLLSAVASRGTKRNTTKSIGGNRHIRFCSDFGSDVFGGGAASAVPSTGSDSARSESFCWRRTRPERRPRPRRPSKRGRRPACLLAAGKERTDGAYPTTGD